MGLLTKCASYKGTNAHVDHGAIPVLVFFAFRVSTLSGISPGCAQANQYSRAFPSQKGGTLSSAS